MHESTSRPIASSLLLGLFLLVFTSAAAPGQEKPDHVASGPRAGLPDSPTGRRVGDLLEAIDATDEGALRRLLEASFTPAFLAHFPMEEHLEVFQELHRELSPARLLTVRKTGPFTAELELAGGSGQGGVKASLQLEAEPPHRIAGLMLEPMAPAQAVEVPENATDAEMVRALESYLEERVAADEFSGTVLLARGEKVLFQKAYGLASKRFGVPNAVDTKLNLGSMNKMFTAVAIAQLAEQGKLAFGDPLIRLVPDYPNREVAEKVTVHHLLTHTSGMGSYWNARFEATWAKLRTVEDLIPLFADEPLAFEPGERMRYSNSGYAVLGLVIERLSGESYDDFVRRHLFEPAGMTDSGAYAMDHPVPNLAIGYTHLGPDGHEPQPGPRRNNLFLHTVKGGPAGGGFSTVGDLHRFSLALQDGRLLRPETLATVLSGKVAMGPDLHYAYGFSERIRGGHRLHGHNGGAPGISADFRFFPGLGYTFAVLANYDGAAHPVGRFLERMITARD